MNHGVDFIAATNAKKLPEAHALLRPKLSSPGESAFAWHEQLSQSATYHWSPRNESGKRLVISNCFRKVSRPSRVAAVPIFDHYKATFNGRDRCNQGMDKKTWPWRPGTNCSGGSDLACIWNDHFACILLNARAIDRLFREDMNWEEFCCDVAKGLIQRRC